MPGAAYEFDATIGVDEAAIVAFAREYDPQPIHTDPAFAKTGPFGGLIASGWQTSALMMRLFADHFLSRVASLASPGLDELRWLRPLRPGDVLRLRVTVVDRRRSVSKPDRGLVRSKSELINQHGEVILSVVALNMLKLRDPG